MSSGAQRGADELRSAWNNVKTTFEGLSKSDIGQVRSTMQAPVDQLRTTLDSVTSGLSCSSPPFSVAQQIRTFGAVFVNQR
jgi:hypothetical protein